MTAVAFFDLDDFDDFLLFFSPLLLFGDDDFRLFFSDDLDDDDEDFLCFFFDILKLQNEIKIFCCY